MAGDEDDKDGDDAGPPAPCSSVQRMRKMRQSFWTARGDEGEAMAAVVLVSSDDNAQWLRAREPEEERSEEE